MTPGLIHPGIAHKAYLAIAVTGGAVAAVFTPFEAIKIVGLTILAGVSHEILSCRVACHDCIEYFTLKHRYDGTELQHRPVRTLNRNLNALAWGMSEWKVGAIGGVILAAFARAPFPKLSSKINARQLAPPIAIGAALILLVAHVKARFDQAAVNAVDETEIPKNLQPGWVACHTRKSIGDTGIKVVGIALTIALIAGRAGLIKL